MSKARLIVNNLLEVDDPDAPEPYVDWLGQKADVGPLEKIRFGAYIYLSDEDMIRQNAEEQGIDVDSQAFWDEVERCMAIMESNCLQILRQAGLHVSDEGHNENARVASVWIDTPDYEQAVGLVKAVVNWAEGDWPSTTSGTMDQAFGADTTQRIYAMTEDAARFIDVTIEFTGTDALVEWSRLNLNEAIKGDPDDPNVFLANYKPRLMGDLFLDFESVTGAAHQYPAAPSVMHKNVDGAELIRYFTVGDMRNLYKETTQRERLMGRERGAYRYRVNPPWRSSITRQILPTMGVTPEEMKLLDQTDAPIWFYFAKAELLAYIRMVWGDRVKIKESADVDDPEAFVKNYEQRYYKLFYGDDPNNGAFVGVYKGITAALEAAKERQLLKRAPHVWMEEENLPVAPENVIVGSAPTGLVYDVTADYAAAPRAKVKEGVDDPDPELLSALKPKVVCPACGAEAELGYGEDKLDTHPTALIRYDADVPIARYLSTADEFDPNVPIHHFDVKHIYKCRQCGERFDGTQHSYAVESFDPDDPEAFLQRFRPKWRVLSHIKNHHFYFVDDTGRVAVADYSMQNQRDPATSDDGLLLLDKTKPITTYRGHDGGIRYHIPLVQYYGGMGDKPVPSATGANKIEFDDLWPKLEPLGFRLQIKEEDEEIDAAAYLDQTTDWIDTFLKAGMTPDNSEGHEGQFYKKYEGHGFNYNVYVHVRDPKWIIVEQNDSLYGKNYFRRVFEFPDKDIKGMVTQFAALDFMLRKVPTSAIHAGPHFNELIDQQYEQHKKRRDKWLSGRVKESADDPESYVRDMPVYTMDEIRDRMQDYGLSFYSDMASFMPWGRWIAIKGFAYWSVYGKDPNKYIPQSFFREQLEKFCRDMGFTVYHIQLMNEPPVPIEFRLAIPKIQVAPESWETKLNILNDPDRQDTAQVLNMLQSEWLPEAVDPDDPEMTLAAHTQDLVPDPDKAQRIRSHTHGELADQLQALGFETSWVAGREVIFGEPYVPTFWSKRYPGTGRVLYVKLNTQTGDTVLSIRTRKMAIPIRLKVRSLAHVGAIVKDVDAALQQLPKGSKEQEIEAVIDVLDHHRQWCVNLGEADELSVPLPPEDDPELSLAGHVNPQQVVTELKGLGFEPQEGERTAWMATGEGVPEVWVKGYKSPAGVQHGVWVRFHGGPGHDMASDVFDGPNNQWRPDEGKPPPYFHLRSMGAYSAALHEIDRMMQEHAQREASPQEEVQALQQIASKFSKWHWDALRQLGNAQFRMESVDLPPEDEPEPNIEQHAQHVEKVEADALESAITMALQEFETRVRLRNITTAKEADELAAEVGDQYAEMAGYENGSDEYDWVVSAVNTKAGEMFPGLWEDYPAEGEIEEAKVDSKQADQFLEILAEDGFISRRELETYKLARTDESDTALLAAYRQVNRNIIDDNVCNEWCRRATQVIQKTNADYHATLADMTKDVTEAEDPDDPEAFLQHMETDWRKILRRHGFKPPAHGEHLSYQLEFPDKVWGPNWPVRIYAGHGWREHVPDDDLNDEEYREAAIQDIRRRDVGHPDYIYFQFGIEPYRRIEVPPNLLDQFLSRLMREIKKVVGTETIQSVHAGRGLTQMIWEAAQRIARELKIPLREAVDNPDDPEMVVSNVARTMPDEKEVLTRLGFTHSDVNDNWHRQISAGRWAYHEPPRWIDVHRATKYERGDQFQYLVTLELYYDDAYMPTHVSFVTDIFNLEDKLKQAIKEWPTRSLRESVDIPPEDEPEAVLPNVEKGLLLPELNRLGFTFRREKGVETIYGEEDVPRYWYKTYEAPDGNTHALYVYFFGGQTPEVHANNFNYTAKAWYQHGRDDRPNAPAQSQAGLSAIVRDLDAAMERSTSESLPPDQEHEAIRRVMQHHRQWWEDTLDYLINTQGGRLPGRIGPGQPA